MLQIVKKVLKVQSLIFHSLIKLFSNQEFNKKDVERVDQIVEKIMNGNKLTRPYYEQNYGNSHQDLE